MIILVQLSSCYQYPVAHLLLSKADERGAATARIQRANELLLDTLCFRHGSSGILSAYFFKGF
jgi:hypothetical protein